MAAQLGTTASTPDGIARAVFKVQGRSIPVHFNPESLTLSFANSIASRGTNDSSQGETGPAAAQQIANTFAATLGMKLQFDTTHTGSDVRKDTLEFQRMLRPTGRGGQLPQVVEFEWGTFRFVGTFISYSETIDYFSERGTPLRASVDISMAENQDLPDPGASSGGGSAGAGFGFGFGASASIEISAQAGISASAAIGGDLFSARAVAELNGEESLRRLSGAPLEVDAEIELHGAVAFATGGISVGAGFGVGVGAGIGVDLSAGGGLGLSLGLAADGGAGFSAGFSVGAGGAGVSGSLLPGAAPSAVGGAAFAGAASVSSASAAAVAASAAPPAFGSPAGFGAGLTTVAVNGPSAAFAAEVAAGPGAAAAAGVRGATSAILSPALASSRAAPAPSASAYARGDTNLGAFASADPTPTQLQGPVWGSHASAGIPATLGAFAGLQARAAPPRVRRRVDPKRLRPPQPEAALHADADALFEIGGRALSREASGLHADVGVNASMTRRIRFDSE